MKILKYITTTAMILCLALFLSQAQATGEIYASMIPASMCSPADSTNSDKLSLTVHGWSFRGTNTGYATIYCPVPFNTIAGPATGVDIHSYRIFYKDPDGTNNQNRIYSYFTERQPNSTSSWMGFQDSNNPQTGYCSSPYYTWKTINNNLEFNNMNGIYVRLYRANTSQNPIFSGADFNFYCLI